MIKNVVMMKDTASIIAIAALLYTRSCSMQGLLYLRVPCVRPVLHYGHTASPNMVLSA